MAGPPSNIQATAVERALDPWEHRSDNMKCRTCIHFVPKKTTEGSGELGRCRRNAPTMRGFPVVFTYDWCGEHRLNEDLA